MLKSGFSQQPKVDRPSDKPQILAQSPGSSYITLFLKPILSFRQGIKMWVMYSSIIMIDIIAALNIIMSPAIMPSGNRNQLIIFFINFAQVLCQMVYILGLALLLMCFVFLVQLMVRRRSLFVD